MNKDEAIEDIEGLLVLVKEKLYRLDALKQYVENLFDDELDKETYELVRKESGTLKL